MNTSRQAELAEKRRYWKQHLSDWAQSGLTQIEYCRRHDLNRHRFHYWKQKLQKQQPAFIELQFAGKKAAGSSDAPLRLVVDGRYQIAVARDFDPVALQQLIGVLSRL